MVSQEQLGIYWWQSWEVEKLKRYILHLMLKNLAWRKKNRIVRIQRWVPIEKYEADKNTRTNETHSPVIKRRQFPLMLSWRCTVLEVQCSSLDSIAVSLTLLRQNRFNYVQIYAVLSWVKPYSGLYLLGQNCNKTIREDPRVSSE